MVTEYIKRGQKMGYDEQGNLVYKIPMDQPSPVFESEELDLFDEVVDEELDEDEG